jgi:hypothetical protein
MRKLPLVVTTVITTTVLIGLGTAVPANADAATGSTGTTFTLGAGALGISVPATASLGSGIPGTTITGALGVVTVTDLRGALAGSWTASVSSSQFITGGGTTAETVDKSNVSYASGAATSTSGVGVIVPGQLTNLLAQSLSVSRTAFSATATVGNTSAVWNPTILVAVPASAVAGTYSGTLTHSVA